MKSIQVVTSESHVQLSISSSEEGDQHVSLTKHEVEILAEALDRAPWTAFGEPRKANMVLLNMVVR